LSRYPHLDTDTHFLFLANQSPQLHWRPWWRRWDWRVCALELMWAATWSLLVAQVIFHGLGFSFMTVAGDWRVWSTALPVLGAALLITIVVIVVNRWRHGFRQGWRTLGQRWARAWKHWRHEYVFPDNEPALLRIAAAHPLLGQLNPYDQAQVVRAWRPVSFKSRTLLSRAGQESDHVGLILSGRAAMNRVGKHGGRAHVVKLTEGGFFGVPAMRSTAEAHPEIKSRTPVAALMMPTSVFKNVVIARLGDEVVYDLTHKYAFLQQLRLCASWHTHAVARFARLARITAYADGDFVLHEKGDAGWLYIVYEGRVQVSRRGKRLSRLKPGDFFGEISLLQNSSAMADVVALGTLRCLQIDRASFLRFMTHNHHVALQLERISSARLGRPIFPLDPLSFEVNGR
jgi:CRP-like cAMP-binding protein